METNNYSLPPLPYDYQDLEPYISKEQLTLHHQKHHAVYVKGANALLEKLNESRKEGSEPDMKAILKELSFHVGGCVLHSLFWENMAPGKGGEPSGKAMEVIKKEFSDFGRFKKEFSQAAVSTEGSGWAALAYDQNTERLVIMQIEKHNMNICPGFRILLVLDVWEHAYYLDYKNERAKFVEAFWNVVNWQTVEKRLNNI